MCKYGRADRVAERLPQGAFIRSDQHYMLVQIYAMVIRAIGVVYAWGSTFFCMVGNTLLFWAVAPAAIALKIIETTAHRASAEEQKEGDCFWAAKWGTG